MKVMGIDPSLNSTGYCIIEKKGENFYVLGEGAIKTPQNTVPQRIYTLVKRIKEAIDFYSPEEVAIENVYNSSFKKSSILLALSAGALISAVCEKNKPIFQYTPTEIKKAVTGWGRAGKKDVQRMVKRLLKIDGKLENDVSDAMAVAICHLFTSSKLRALR